MVALSKANPGDVIIGGAYAGEQALFVAANTEHSVHCFEPGPIKSLLDRNIAVNGLSNVTTSSKPLSDLPEKPMVHDGEGPLAQCTPCSSANLRSETIDRYAKRNRLKVSLIQLDIEGGEKDALAGALDTLKRDQPTVILEIHSSFYSFSEPLVTIPHVAQLADLGYKLFAIRDYWGGISQLISPIELIPLDKAKVDGPEHGFNLLALPKTKGRLPFDYHEVTFKSPKLIPQKNCSLFSPENPEVGWHELVKSSLRKP